jgi:hypothetical protein
MELETSLVAKKYLCPTRDVHTSESRVQIKSD